MQLALPTHLSEEKICRGMGQPAHVPPTAQTLALAQKAAGLVLAAARPRAVSCRLELDWQAGRPCPKGALRLEGEDIAAHLAGCTGCVLLAVTLGPGIDQLLRRLGGQVELDCAADAAASLLAEEMADAAEAAVRAGLEEGVWMTGRFSPGYGDLPLTAQPGLLETVNARRTIGLAVSSAGILTPRKSITAILGLADHPVKGRLAGCAHCALRDTCRYRKEGKRCADQ